MQTVSSQLGQPQLETFTPHAELVSADALGIELELEGFSGDSMDQTSRLVRPLWSIIGDGSLRNGGVEFITQGGFGGEKLVRAIDKLQTTLERVNYDASWRCSTHMHINMLDFTVNQVARFILVYAACEPVLFEFCGAYRKSSNFCTPLGDSLPFHRKIMSRMYDDAISRRSPQQVANKYVALNVLPLFPDQRGRALGTVEFRGGRPLVSREDMILQANLLLSIKQYVREFNGDEEAMLTELGNGVQNTVYANGVAAGISANPEALELALVNAWALLKSYQQGRAQGIQEARLQAERDAMPENSIPVSARGARQMSQGAHVDTIGMGVMETLGHLSNYVQQRTWPAIHAHYNELASTLNPERMMLTAFSVCLEPSTRQHGPLTHRNIVVSLMNWAGLVTASHPEQTPLNTMIRLRRNTNMGSGRHQEPAESIPGIINNAMIGSTSFSSKCLYEQTLSQSKWRELQGRCGYSSNSTNRDIWNWLLQHRVRIKGRIALHEAMNECGVSPSNYTGCNLEVGTVSTVTFIRLLRILGLRSSNHIWNADRAEYDKVVYILRMLEDAELRVPFSNPLSGQLQWCHPRGLGRNSGQGFSEEALTREYQIAPSRTVEGSVGVVNVY